MKNLFKSVSKNLKFKQNFIWRETQGNTESIAKKPTHAENIKQMNSMVEKVLKELDTLDHPNYDDGNLSITRESRSSDEAKKHMDSWTELVTMEFRVGSVDVSVKLGKRLDGEIFINIEETPKLSDTTTHNLTYSKSKNKIYQHKTSDESKYVVNKSNHLIPVETSNNPEKTTVVLEKIQKKFNSAYRKLHAVADNNAVKESDAEIDDLLSGLA